MNLTAGEVIDRVDALTRARTQYEHGNLRFLVKIWID